VPFSSIWQNKHAVPVGTNDACAVDHGLDILILVSVKHQLWLGTLKVSVECSKA